MLLKVVVLMTSDDGTYINDE